MRKRILVLLMMILFIIPMNVVVKADPKSDLTSKREEYKSIQQKIDKEQGKIYKLQGEMEPLLQEKENNDKKIKEYNKEIKELEVKIKDYEDKMKEKEEILGERIRELYKSGGQVSYLTVILGANDFTDFLKNLETTNLILQLDKDVIEELASSQEELNNKKAEINQKKKELNRLTLENERALEEFKTKEEECKKLIKEIKKEEEKFDEEYLSILERDLVSYQFGIINNSSSKEELQEALSQLESMKSQIKSEIVTSEINSYIEKGSNKIDKLVIEEQQSNIPESAKGNEIVTYAYKFLNTPYEWGAEGPNTFDCSGFTSYVFRNVVGIEITRTTDTQMQQGVGISASNMKPGDLVFTYRGGHVGIYIGDGKYIHASQPGDVVKVSPVLEFHLARRIL